MNTTFETRQSFQHAFEAKLQLHFNQSITQSTIETRYVALASLLQEEAKRLQQQTNDILARDQKKTIYFSMEFLMGRMITNNLYNLGHYQVVKQSFDELGLDLNEVEQYESDAGLGNGGLGRLAACFLDSAASLGLPLFGNSIRYKKGFFIQDIKDYKQQEFADPWLDKPYIWEERMEEDAINIPYYGYVENIRLLNPVWIKAVPYDVFIVGDQNEVVTKLRLWSTESSELQQHQSESYLKMVAQISESLYPDDSKDEGKTLRLQQQYLFSAAGVLDAIREHKRLGRSIKEFHRFYTFQLNDTHPTVVIPEMMRILMDEEHLGYDEAWSITTQTCAFTNHTILSEALEKWNIPIFRNLLPRIYEIIAEMNRRFKASIQYDIRFEENDRYMMQMIGENHLRMANIAIVGSFSVNGVAALHTDILKQIVMKRFYTLFPEKFNNKTNGVTHRRWLLQINPELSKVLDETIGTSYHHNLDDLNQLLKFKDDQNVLTQIKDVKKIKKQQLTQYILKHEGVQLIEDGIFDIQIKRLHEYKRQLMNIMHIIYVYERLKSDPIFKANYVPHNFIFGAKAAPSYMMAKDIIELINRTAEVINHDKEVDHLLKVVFVKNYNVTYAEKLIPACDLSEQISTASKEASGTGNMKFMMNGALTIGTMDGANVEIVHEAGKENAFIFGLSAEEVNDIYKHNHYVPKAIYDQDPRLQGVFGFIRTLTPNPQHFDFILSTLLNSDYYLIMKDFDAYIKAHEAANEAYKEDNEWAKKSLINTATSGFFSSDRTIAQYNQDIWHLNKIQF
jgi:glycogen phosphorylase